jgi:hypothetical protein
MYLKLPNLLSLIFLSWKDSTQRMEVANLALWNFWKQINKKNVTSKKTFLENEVDFFGWIFVILYIILKRNIPSQIPFF